MTAGSLDKIDALFRDGPAVLNVGISMFVPALVAVGGIWMFVFFGQLKKHPLLPTREVYLLEAYHHGH